MEMYEGVAEAVCVLGGYTWAIANGNTRAISSMENSVALGLRVRHKGNHKYAWPLNVAIRRQLPASLPYPKSLDPFTPLCKKRAPHSR